MGNETSSIVNDSGETAYIKIYGTEIYPQGPPKFGSKNWDQLSVKLEDLGFHELRPGDTHISTQQTAGWRLDCGGYLVIDRDESGRPSKLEVFKVKTHLFCGSGGVSSVYRLKDIRQCIRYLEPTPIPKTLKEQARDTIGSSLRQLRERPVSQASVANSSSAYKLVLFYIAIALAILAWFFYP